jgi:3-hydroxyacyl-CoA dehydrogenase
MFRKKLLIPVFAVTIVGAGLFGTHQVSAQSTDGTTDVVTLIAQKFSLDKNQVQQVFDQHHQEMKIKRQTKMEERLTQLVKDGKLTESQKQAVLTKMAEEKNSFNPQSFKDLTPEQRKTQMDQHRQEMENWAKSQGIDLSLIRPLKMGRAMHWMH